MNTRVLVNDYRKEQIFHAHGLRQGDQVWAQLLILPMDVVMAIFAKE
jgi:hypothetical protein